MMCVNVLVVLFQRNPRKFAREFGLAYTQLQNLDQNPDYSLPLIGEAYCLKYHLQRMDNVSIALNYTHGVHTLLQSSAAMALDIGGGTGGSTMAIARWAAANVNLQSTSISITCAEPSTPMRETAQRLVPSMLNYLSAANSIYRPFPISARIIDKSLEECAIRCRETRIPPFDLIIFSYALWKQRPDEWPSTTDLILDVARKLKPGGMLMFLSPKKPSEKVRFMQRLTRQLIADGFTELQVSIPRQVEWFPNRTSCAPVKRPACLQDLLHKANSACNELTGTYPLGESFGENKDDYPYYGFYGRVEAFTCP